ncbi:hypothetical protein ABEW32_20835 [Paenibacillus jamilae]|uniref:hypothetical protein n=1 Tax=Paenibacillus jamilae TaxID=114136 RepID=UPI003D2C9E20
MSSSCNILLQPTSVSAAGTTSVVKSVPYYRQQKANPDTTFTPTGCSSLFIGQAVC